MSAKRVFLVPVLACLCPGLTFAVPIQVDYTQSSLGDFTCFTQSPPEVCQQALQSINTSPGLPATTMTFDIDELDRAVDGTYDVTASLAGSLLDLFAAAIAKRGSGVRVPSVAVASTTGVLVGMKLVPAVFACALASESATANPAETIALAMIPSLPRSDGCRREVRRFG